MGLLPPVLHSGAARVDVGVVDLDDAEGVRADALAHEHVGAGELADLRQWDRLVALPAATVGAAAGLVAAGGGAAGAAFAAGAGSALAAGASSAGSGSTFGAAGVAPTLSMWSSTSSRA